MQTEPISKITNEKKDKALVFQLVAKNLLSLYIYCPVVHNSSYKFNQASQDYFLQSGMKGSQVC